MQACPYANSLGLPGQDIYSYRIANIAVIDVILTLIATYILLMIINLPIHYSVIGLFFLGIGIHWLFCVRTTVDKLLFP